MKRPLNEEIVSEIIKIVNRERDDLGITNDIVRDDVFYLLDYHCIILYYPLASEDINGYHISKYINGEKKEFVFINTENTTEKQVFAAAHELGHILKVDETICNMFNLSYKEYAEDIVNRFAAELLMPKGIFTKKLNWFLKNYNNGSDSLSTVRILELTVYLMNEFLVEYEAIIRRFFEINELKENEADILLKLKEANELEKILKTIAKTANYPRLFIRSRNKSMSELVESIGKAKVNNSITEEKINRLINRFEIVFGDISDDNKSDTYTLKADE